MLIRWRSEPWRTGVCLFRVTKIVSDILNTVRAHVLDKVDGYIQKYYITTSAFQMQPTTEQVLHSWSTRSFTTVPSTTWTSCRTTTAGKYLLDRATSPTANTLSSSASSLSGSSLQRLVVTGVSVGLPCSTGKEPCVNPHHPCMRMVENQYISTYYCITIKIIIIIITARGKRTLWYFIAFHS